MILYTRINDWLFSKIPMVLGVIYFGVYASGATLSSSVALLVLGLSIMSVGFASIGYLINDWFDKDKDNRVEKTNVFNKVNATTRVAFFLISICCALVPWFWLPFNSTTWVLLIIELLLFLIYSAPPLRLKEQGWFGVINDGLYAMVVPTMILVHTVNLAFDNLSFFSSLTHPWPFLLMIYMFFSGLRKILCHQIEDYLSDIKSKTRTLVVSIGLGRSEQLHNQWLIPIEAITLVLFIGSLISVSFGLGLLATVVLTLQLLFSPIGEGLLLYRPNPSSLWNRKLDVFLEGYFPVLVLLSLTFVDLNYVFILIAHFILFLPSLTSIVDFGKDYIGKPAYYRGSDVLYHRGVRLLYFRGVHFIYRGVHIVYFVGLLKVHNLVYSRTLRPFYYTFIHTPLVWAYYNIVIKSMSWFWHLGYFAIHGKWHPSKGRQSDTRP